MLFTKMRLVLRLLGTIVCLVGAGSLGFAQAESTNRVALVVQYGDGSVDTRCIEFSEAQISGYDVLLRSGLALEVSVEGGMGAFICGIGEEGCPATDCMCDYPPNYWSYWHLLNGEWVYSQMGAGGYMVSPGNVEGWNWGAGNPPVVIPLEQICVPPATDTPTPTATWTSSPTASATPTPTPTRTPTASATPTPTYTPTPVPPTSTAMPSVTSLPTATPSPTTIGAPPATATKTSTSTPVPTSTALPTGAPTTAPPTAAETAEPTVAVTAAASATPLQPTPTPTFSPSPMSTSLATAMPTHVAVVTRAAAPEQPPLSQQDQEAKGPEPGKLLTWLSVGAGVAYLFFIAFVALLGALFVFVKLRQR
jgi:hypothetical protein